MGSFGDKFRKERERRGFTLDDVSNVTKINSRMLKAIEDEHFDLLPGGVFNKGFVRAYSKHLGFNDEDSITEYLVALRQAQVLAQTAAWQADGTPQSRADRNQSRRQYPQQPSPEQARAEQVQEEKARQEKALEEKAQQILAEQLRIEPSSPPTIKVSTKTVPAGAKREVRPEPRPELKISPPVQKAPESPTLPVTTAPPKYPPADLQLGHVIPHADSIPWKVPVVVLAMILIAAVFWNRHSRAVKAESAASPHASGLRVAAAENSAAPAATSTIARPLAAVLTSPMPKSGSSSSATGTDRSLASSIPAAAHNGDVTTSHPSTDGSVPDHGTGPRKPAVAPAIKAPPVFSLRIRASQTTWIAVIADGQPLAQETLIAPASTSIRAKREITVRIGNAAGISFLLNGKEIPPQGAQAEVKTLTFDSKGIKDASRAGPNP